MVRVLTGIIQPLPAHLTHGMAEIRFDPHTVVGDANGIELEETGGPGPFISRPGKVVSLREFRSIGPRDRDWFRINDHVWDIHRLAVVWHCEMGAEIREISYLIVGEV